MEKIEKDEDMEARAALAAPSFLRSIVLFFNTLRLSQKLLRVWKLGCARLQDVTRFTSMCHFASDVVSLTATLPRKTVVAASLCATSVTKTFVLCMLALIRRFALGEHFFVWFFVAKLVAPLIDVWFPIFDSALSNDNSPETATYGLVTQLLPAELLLSLDILERRASNKSYSGWNNMVLAGGT